MRLTSSWTPIEAITNEKENRMRRYFAILTILLLGFSVQFGLGQPEEEKAETESREPVKTQEGQAEKSQDTPKELGESRRQVDREHSRSDWRGAVERFRNASPEEQQKMRGEFVRRLRSRGGNMERRGNGRRRQNTRETDFQQRERDMEMERREQEHRFQLDRMQKEHEIEMERLEQDRIREMRQHGAPHLDFDFELHDDEMSDEQRGKIQLIRFRLEQREIQKMAEIRIKEIEVKIALRRQFFSQKMADTKPIEELINAIAILQSEIKILKIKAMVKSKSLLNPEQLKHLINQSKETH
jgi:hypothetical protein